MGEKIIALSKDTKSETGLCVQAELGEGPEKEFDSFKVKFGGE